MRSRFWRSATRSGWRGPVVLPLVPVLAASFCTAQATHGLVRSAAGLVYLVAAAVFLILAWQIGGRDA